MPRSAAAATTAVVCPGISQQVVDTVRIKQAVAGN